VVVPAASRVRTLRSRARQRTKSCASGCCGHPGCLRHVPVFFERCGSRATSVLP
jgi:hypothetical protein